MNMANKSAIVGLSGAFILMLSACTAEVGSEKWCAAMKDKPQGEWTANEASDYAKNCLLKQQTYRDCIPDNPCHDKVSDTVLAVCSCVCEGARRDLPCDVVQ